MTAPTQYRPTAEEIATYTRAIAAALPGDWTMPEDQETHWAARLVRADGLKLFLGFQTYGAKLGRLEVTASTLTDHPGKTYDKAVTLTPPSAPTFAALGEKGQSPEACAAAIARRVLTADLETKLTTARANARDLADACARFRADCAALAAPWGDMIRIEPDHHEPHNKARINIDAPGLHLTGYAYRDGDQISRMYLERGGHIDRDALLHLLAAFAHYKSPAK